MLRCVRELRVYSLQLSSQQLRRSRLRFEVAGLVTALCHEGGGARAFSTMAECVTVDALAGMFCQPESSDRLRRAAGEAVDCVCGAPSGADAALSALPALIGALTSEDIGGGATALVGAAWLIRSYLYDMIGAAACLIGIWYRLIDRTWDTALIGIPCS